MKSVPKLPDRIVSHNFTADGKPCLGVSVYRIPLRVALRMYRHVQEMRAARSYPGYRVNKRFHWSGTCEYSPKTTITRSVRVFRGRISIGCQEFTFKEIDQIAKVYGWDKK